MTREDYKIASERHLIACFELYNKATFYQKKQNLSNKEKRYQMLILEDLYYLSGYMLECLYSYGMCKFEGVTGDVSRALRERSVRRNHYRICYSHSARSRLHVRYSLTRDKHRMSMSELGYFTDSSYGNFVSTAHQVPLLGGSHLGSPNSHQLFSKWNVYERYKVNYFPTEPSSVFPLFNYDNVTNFFWDMVDVCAKMTKYILREITLFLRIIKKRP